MGPITTTGELVEVQSSRLPPGDFDPSSLGMSLYMEEALGMIQPSFTYSVVRRVFVVGFRVPGGIPGAKRRAMDKIEATPS